MLNIGGGELLIILLVALIFLGPTRLPEVARQLGQTVSSLRAMATGFQAELEAAARPDPPAFVEKPKSVADPEAIGRAAREISADPLANTPGSVSAGGPVDLRKTTTRDDPAVEPAAGLADADADASVQPLADLAAADAAVEPVADLAAADAAVEPVADVADEDE